MRKTWSKLGLSLLSLLLGVFVFTSCSFGKKAQVTIHDGEMQWPDGMFVNGMSATNSDGSIAIWAPFFSVEVGNSLRSLGLSFKTTEPGTYSGVYDPANQKWSNDAFVLVKLNLDYDGIAYPTWWGQSATFTIHSYDKRSKRISATLEAIVVKEGTSESRNIRVDFKDLKINW